MQDLKERYLSVKKSVADAAISAGRRAEDVTVLAAVKYATAEEINFLHRECGLCHIGENRVQHLLEHYDALEDKENISIHFIGSLQKNKVKYVVGKVCLIHSLDSLSLAAEIEKQSAKRGIVTDVLVEINCGREAQKGGVMPEDAADFCLALSSLAHVRLRGFMTMAPKCEKKEEYFNYFQETSQLVLDIWQEKLHNIYKPVLSMGMSASVIPAIEAGADIVRIGSAIFGRTTPLN